jgi:hypothetical protein
MAQVEEHLHKALSSNSSTTKKKKRKKKVHTCDPDEIQNVCKKYIYLCNIY